SYNKEEVRTIVIHIPKGYEIKNLNDLNMDYNYEKNREKIYNFTSSYEVKDSVLYIHLTEYYKDINCPKENYDAFRKVVDASADFNKITLLLKPISTR
ncbi:MAG: hypothetical protein WAN50_03000, partial [Minisyncoccia bacterium]